MAYLVEALVVDNRQLPNQNFMISVEAPDIARNALPGQFVMASCSTGQSLPQPLLRRALAVYAIRGREVGRAVLTFLVKVVGDGTRGLAALKPGDSMSLIGPLGNGFDLQRAKGRINFLVVGGTGVASVYLLAETLNHYGEDVHLVYGARSAEDLVGLEDFRRLGIPVFVATEDGTLGHRGLVTEGFTQYLAVFPIDKSNLYTCGPNPMMQAVTELAAHHHIPCQISVESKMACGFGICLGCSIKTTHAFRLACTDGPVFDAAEFVWENRQPMVASA